MLEATAAAAATAPEAVPRNIVGFIRRRIYAMVNPAPSPFLRLGRYLSLEAQDAPALRETLKRAYRPNEMELSKVTYEQVRG